jgi:hypothetical protein
MKVLTVRFVNGRSCGDDRCNRSNPAHERPGISSASASNIRRPTSVMHLGIALSRCSATDSGLRGLARLESFPLRRATLMGFTSALRRFAPAAGGRPFLIVRAHMPVRRNRSPRLIFVRRSVFHAEARSCDRLDWLLGFRSRLRSVSRSDCEIRREIVPALGFASCRVCGHIEVHSDGLDPARIAKPQGQ